MHINIWSAFCFVDAAAIECSDWLQWSIATCLEHLPIASRWSPQASVYQLRICMTSCWRSMFLIFQLHRPVLVFLRCLTSDILYERFMSVAATKRTQHDLESRTSNW